MHIPITRNFSLFNYVLFNDALKVEYKLEEANDLSNIHYKGKKFFQFTLPTNIEKANIKGVIIKTYKKLQYSSDGFHETVPEPKNYLIPISAHDDSKSIVIEKGKYINNDAKNTESTKIIKELKEVEIEAFKKIFESLVADSEKKTRKLDTYKILIPSLEFYQKFKDEYITEKIIAQLRSDGDVKNIYTEIIDDIFDDSKIVQSLSNIIEDCKILSLVYGDMKLEYGIISKKTVKNWHVLFYNAFKVVLKDKESCLEIKKSLKNFDILSDVHGQKHKINFSNLVNDLKREMISNLNINYDSKLEFQGPVKMKNKLTFEQDLKQFVSFCVYHLQIQCSYFFNILKLFRNICEIAHVDMKNIVNYEIPNLKFFKKKFSEYTNQLSSSELQLHDEKFINSLKVELEAIKLNLVEQKQELYDILGDPSIFLQFILLIESPKSFFNLYSEYYSFQMDTLVPPEKNTTLMIYDSISKLPKRQALDNLILKKIIQCVYQRSVLKTQ